MTSIVSLQPCRTFLKHFVQFLDFSNKLFCFAGRPALQNRTAPSETNCWHEDCLIFSNNYLEKQSQTLVGKSMNSSLTFENIQAKICGSLCSVHVAQHHLVISIFRFRNAKEFTPAILFCLDHTLFTPWGVNNAQLARDIQPIRLLETPISLSEYILNIFILITV